MLLVNDNNLQRRKRSPAFTGSVLAHAALVFILASQPAYVSVRKTPSVRRSVLLLRLQDYRPKSSAGASSSSGAGALAASQVRQPAAGQGAGLHFERQQAVTDQNIAQDLAESASAAGPEHHRLFELPPTHRVDPVKQTLVQFDVPPDVQLKHDVPLPNALLWMDQPVPPPFRKRFVAPPVRQMPKVAANLPAAPSLLAPNQEVTIADVKLASAVLNGTRKLILPPSKTAPIRSAAAQPVIESPQIILPDPSATNVTPLISLPDTPVRSDQIVVLPPANQIAAASGSDRSGSGSGNHGEAPGAGDGKGNHSGGIGGANSGLGTDNSSSGQGAALGMGAGEGGAGTSAAAGSGAASNGGTGNQPGGGSGTGASGAGNSAGSGSGSGLAGTGTGAGKGGAGSGTGVSGSGTGATGSAGNVGDYSRGLTRITLPKDGKFGVVVLGSSPSSPYPESVGSLPGKMVYTVYLKVGLKKSWMLQYCLPRSVEQSHSAAPLDAPYPFLMMRPDQITDDNSDYILVHGMINLEGRFDELAMIFPQELPQKDLLMSSLKLWAFRPASRDGEPTAVEVLLVIPKESE